MSETTLRPSSNPKEDPPCHPAATKSSSVIIIGAGMSGLCAARSLTNANYTNVTLLEARSYIGGRTITKQIGDSGVMVDAGAAWIHGTKDNPLIAMCEDYGIPYVPHPEMKKSTAAAVDVTTAENDDEKMKRVAWTQEESEKVAPLIAEFVPTLQPGVSATDAFDAFFSSDIVKEAGLTPTEINRATFMIERIISGTAGPMDDLNIYYPANGLSGRLSEGYDQLIVGGYNALVEKLGDGLNIELEKVVNKIEYLKSDDGVKITCNDGSEYTADYVICSIPLGVLKSHSVEFVPTLSEEKCGALDRLKMGGFEKVILVFDDHFFKGWKENLDEVSSASVT